MTDELKIRTLTEHFLDGDTTLSEEQWLYEVYRRGNVPDDLKPLRQMFLDYGAMATGNVATGGTQAERSRPGRWLWAVAAAVVALLVGGAVTVMHYERANECVAYVYGQRITDRQQVMAELKQSMGTFVEEDATGAVDAQLRDLFVMDE